MSKPLSGRCLNIGNCEIANSMAPIKVEDGAEFICSECGKPLVASESSSGSKNNNLAIGVVAIGSVCFIVAAILAVTTLLKSKSPSAPNTGAQTNAGKPASRPSKASVILRLAGSNTLGSKLAPALVEAYFKSKGCTDVAQLKVEIELINVTCKLNGNNYLATISFKGSGTAFTGLKNGTADIGMASRRVKPAEVASLVTLGNLTSPANEHVVALDGIAIIVNASNLLPRLSIPNVRSIFAGDTRTFSLVGGPSTPVTLYRRDDKSGTYDSFKSLVMNGTPVSPSAKTFEDSNELSSAVVADQSSIGFVGHTLIGSARAVPIGVPGQQALLPNRFTIQTEDYPLSRRLYFYAHSEGGNKEVAQFITFTASKAGQAVVEAENFVPLDIVSARSALPANSSNGYQAVTAGAERLSVNFRFNSGSNDLDNRALADLDRVTEYLIRTSTKPSKLVLIGFADNTGNPASNVVLSKERSNAVATALKSRGITPGLTTGFGAENPVASNSTPDGQQKNRRVEVWITR